MQITINNQPLDVKLAKTPEQQARGLMNISSLPDNEGLLFCYPKEKKLSFWMKSTPIPLSIAFIDKNKRITQIEELKPYDETGVKTIRPTKWALEVNSGWFDNHNIKVGDTVNIPLTRDIKIRVIKLPREANQLAKTLEDKLVDMTVSALKTKLSVDQLKNLNIDVEVE
tara:strand:- start:423 stop:929 length:507 start_codon:yes stop_codon:yes gene_type:complete